MLKQAVLLSVLAAAAVAAPNDRVFTGTITDTMCGADHAMMGKTPAPQCTVACVKSNPREIKYALVSGKNVYTLSDQAAPEKFAGKRVKVTGTLDAKTKTIRVSQIASAR